METKTPTKTPPTIQGILNREDVIEKLNKMMGKKAQAFITSVLQIANSNEMLKKADPMSIYNGAMTAATLDLPLNNSLGLSYLVPFNTTMPDKTKKVMAVFMIGYMGLHELALRSGRYKKIDAVPVYDGQLVSKDPKRGFTFNWEKKSKKLVGYYAFFILNEGFEKEVYMTTEEIHDHAKRFSKTYGNQNSAWATDFEAMAKKTVLRALLKFGPKSIQYQQAEAMDEFVPDKPHEEEVVDAVYAETDVEREKLTLAIDAANTPESLSILKMQIGANDYLDLQDAIDQKIEKLNSAKKK